MHSYQTHIVLSYQRSPVCSSCLECTSTGTAPPPTEPCELCLSNPWFYLMWPGDSATSSSEEEESFIGRVVEAPKPSAELQQYSATMMAPQRRQGHPQKGEWAGTDNKQLALHRLYVCCLQIKLLFLLNYISTPIGRPDCLS